MIKKIQALVAQHYGVSMEDMLSSSCNMTVAEARQVAIYVARKYTAKSMSEISKAFNRQHATVINAVDMIKMRIAGDETLRETIDDIRGQLMAKESAPEKEAVDHWRRIQAFLQEVGIVNDYLHWRVLCKRYGEQPGSPLFAMVADTDGELTDEVIIEKLEAIARQARAGFVAGEGFPLFGSLER